MRSEDELSLARRVISWVCCPLALLESLKIASNYSTHNAAFCTVQSRRQEKKKPATVSSTLRVAASVGYSAHLHSPLLIHNIALLWRCSEPQYSCCFGFAIIRLPRNKNLAGSSVGHAAVRVGENDHHEDAFDELDALEWDTATRGLTGSTKRACKPTTGRTLVWYEHGTAGG